MQQIQRNRLQEKLPKKKEKKREPTINRKNVILLYRTTSDHKITQEKIRKLSWTVLLYPLYSPNFALSDFYLFRLHKNLLNGKHFHYDAEIVNLQKQNFVLYQIFKNPSRKELTIYRLSIRNKLYLIMENI